MGKNKYIKEVIAAALLLVAYIPTFIWMWDRWFAKESYYGHGALIPLVSLYFLWQRRDLLRKTKKSNQLAGLFIVGAGLFVHMACAMLKVYFISGFSFVFVLFGLVLFFFGKEVTKKLIFPIFFLLAMIPFPLVLVGNLVVKLKLLAAGGGTFILNRIGFPSILDGSIIRMPNSFISIGAPCSGLRSLIALITLGIIFAHAMGVSYFKKGLVLLSAVPIAIASNILRITMLAVINDLYGQKLALGFFHDFSGFLVFVFAFLGLFGVGRMLEPKKDEE